MPDASIPSLMPLWVRHFPLLLALGALPFMYVATSLGIRASRSNEPLPPSRSSGRTGSGRSPARRGPSRWGRSWRLKENRREEARALLLALAAEDTSDFASTSAAGILAEGGFCDDTDRLAGEHQLLDDESRWSGWLAHRLRGCSDGQVLVRETGP